MRCYDNNIINIIIINFHYCCLLSVCNALSTDLRYRSIALRYWTISRLRHHQKAESRNRRERWLAAVWEMNWSLCAQLVNHSMCINDSFSKEVWPDRDATVVFKAKLTKMYTYNSRILYCRPMEYINGGQRTVLLRSAGYCWCREPSERSRRRVRLRTTSLNCTTLHITSRVIYKQDDWLSLTSAKDVMLSTGEWGGGVQRVITDAD